MHRTVLFSLIALFSCVFSIFPAPSFAGMTRDLANCTRADRPHSAAACTRVLKSGRLPRRQFYIAYYNRGWSHRNAGKFKHALKDFNTAAKFKPSYADTYYSRAIVHRDMGDKDSAAQDADAYLERKGNTWKARYNSAIFFRRLSQPQRALSDLDRAGQLAQGKPKIAALRALILSDMGSHAKALASLDEARGDNADDAGFHYARALIAFRQQRSGVAVTHLEKAIAAEKVFPAAHTLLGRIAEGQGDRKVAKAHYKKALQFRANTVGARASQDEARQHLAVLANLPEQDSRKMRQATIEPAPDEADSDDAAEPEPRKEIANHIMKGVDAAKTLDCKRYVPAVGVTVAVACSK